jgi:hypothetical protein
MSTIPLGGILSLVKTTASPTVGRTPNPDASVKASVSR